MVSKEIVMEKELAKVVWALTPERTTFKFKSGEKWYLHLLTMAAPQGLKAEAKTVSFEVVVWYEFFGFENLPTGGWVAIYKPRFYIALIEDEDRRGWRENNPRNLTDLENITKLTSIEKDIQDIKLMSLYSINAEGVLIENGRVWVRR